MLFNTSIYPLFLALCVALYWIVPRTMRVYVLIIASIVFYAFNSIEYLVLLAVMATVVYIFAKKIQKNIHEGVRKKYFYISIVSIVGLLIWFKYANLLFGGLEHFIGVPEKTWWMKIAMPLGISFFTFEFIHYLIDIYHKQIPPHRAEDFFSFVFFFPTLASGPIKRFQTFVHTLHENVGFSKEYFYSGCIYIVLGYAQKYLIADNLIERTAFLSTPSLAPTAGAIISGLVFYSLRIYFDFAGLSNIAIGSALLFGIKVPINFSYPYFRPNLAAFWRNWHMSLTSWIRDYVYMPLVFRFRNSKVSLVGGLVITMALVGLWHGSSLNFLFFGIYHGVGLAILQVIRMYKKKKILHPKLSYVLGVGATFIYVTVGWGFFVTTSLHDSFLLYHRVFASLL